MKLKQKLKKIKKVVAIFKKISSLVFTNPNIPALKYGRWKKIQLMNFLILNPKSIKILNTRLWFIFRPC